MSVGSLFYGDADGKKRGLEHIKVAPMDTAISYPHLLPSYRT